MFFFASKIVWAALAPANLVLILVGLGLLVSLKWRRAGLRILWVGFAIFVLFGLLPTGHNLLYGLEDTYKPPLRTGKVDGIVVLGGAVETRASEASGKPEFNDGVERVLAAMELSHRYPGALVVFSGGSGLLIPGKRTESQEVNALLAGLGFNTDMIFYEEDSRNSYENIKYTMEMVAPQPEETWLLVTSAWHMPRSIAIARKLGWNNLIAYPVDYRSLGRYILLPPKFDVLDNLNASSLATREYMGMIAYRLSGKL